MKINNLLNENRKFTSEMGPYHVLESMSDLSVSPWNAVSEYYMAQMGVHRRQLVIDLNGQNSVKIQAGAMQWMAGNISAQSGVKGVGDFFGKAIKGAVTKEGIAKPEYAGVGTLVLEPTYKYILLMDVGMWNGGMTIEDGMFYACDGTIETNIVSRSNFSSAALGGEGLFNTSLSGRGIAALESVVPFNELVEIDLQNEEIKIDGNLAVCWSSTLNFTVEKSTKSLIDSAVSGEGLVNVYRGTGRILMSPVAPTSSAAAAAGSTSAKPAAQNSNTAAAVNNAINSLFN